MRTFRHTKSGYLSHRDKFTSRFADGWKPETVPTTLPASRGTNVGFSPIPLLKTSNLPNAKYKRSQKVTSTEHKASPAQSSQAFDAANRPSPSTRSRSQR